MFALLPTDGIPAGSVVIVGMDWGGFANPGKADIERIWPGMEVGTWENSPFSNAIIETNRFATAAQIAQPCYDLGARRVLVFRVENPDSGAKDLGTKVLADLNKARDFLFSPFTGGEESAGVFKTAKTVAVTLAVVAGLAGVALIAFHYTGK